MISFLVGKISPVAADVVVTLLGRCTTIGARSICQITKNANRAPCEHGTFFIGSALLAIQKARPRKPKTATAIVKVIPVAALRVHH